MKINEIIVEGPFGWLADKMVNRSNVQSGKKDAAQIVRSVSAGWQSYVAKAGLDLKTNPEQYKQYLDAFLNKSLGIQVNNQAALANNNDVAKYIQIAYQEKVRQDMLPDNQASAAQPAQQGQPNATQTSQQTGVTPANGRRIVVSAPNGGKYYQTADGWFNAVGDKVVNAKSIEYLDTLVDSGGGAEEPIPDPLPSQQPTRQAQPQQKRRKSRR